jgi:acyl-coenzyme A thioesterase PaaI-like protein
VRATEAALRDLLAGAAFTPGYGFRLVSARDGECTLEAPFRPSFERPGGVVSGPVFMAAADAAMWLAILTRLGPDDGSVTAEMTTAFLGAARREGFRCTARVLRWGRRLVYGVAECVGGDGRLLTHHTVTYARPAAPSAP